MFHNQHPFDMASKTKLHRHVIWRIQDEHLRIGHLLCILPLAWDIAHLSVFLHVGYAPGWQRLDFVVSNNKPFCVMNLDLSSVTCWMIST